LGTVHPRVNNFKGQPQLNWTATPPEKSIFASGAPHKRQTPENTFAADLKRHEPDKTVPSFEA
jgi:hypothetical protein